MSESQNKLKVTEAAKILGVSRVTVLKWIDDGILRAYRAGAGCMWLIDRDDLNKVLKPSITIESEAAPNARNNNG